MNAFIKSYLAYTRGECFLSPWLLLKPVGWLGKGVVRLRRALYDHGFYSSEETPVSVISVGNLTTGGTNKTPFVEFISRRLLEFGLHPGIVSRGYGGHASAPIVITDGRGERGIVGDEPLLLSSHLPGVPVAVSSDRIADVLALRGYNVDIVVADDAFQHRKMARALDIVLVDATCPFGNGASLPDGILRELPSSLSRAHVVVITKAEQVSASALSLLKNRIGQWVPQSHIFYSRLSRPEWLVWQDHQLVPMQDDGCHLKRFMAFSGIGSPKSFLNTVKASGAEALAHVEYKDHHHYDFDDMRLIENNAAELGAEALCCTEKDIYNLPEGYKFAYPLCIPRITSILEEEERFWSIVLENLQPRLVVASNGYGEDAMGVRLATMLKKRFPSAQICAFPLVGKGEQYSKNGIEIISPVVDTPTGGIIKYDVKDLYTELKAGLLRHIGSQLRKWKSIRSRCNTVLCVGDTYLLCHTLWGQGKKAVLVATAKTKYISGHWKLESFLYRKGCRKVWTRDEATADELRDNGVNAVFEGNPIMDLQCDAERRKNLWRTGRRILVLPGSRGRAYRDLHLVLGALEKIASRYPVSAVMVLAPSIEVAKIVQNSRGWKYDGHVLMHENITLDLFTGDVSEVAHGAELLLGLAGTANQVCAGIGIPVLSIKEKGKFVQKKLLGDAELLVAPDADSLSNAALELLDDPERLAFMGEAGRKRLGASGALESVVRYAENEFGWSSKCALYEKLYRGLNVKYGGIDSKEVFQ